MLECVKEKLPPPKMGVLEAVALDAVLGFPLEAGGMGSPQMRPRGQK